MGRVAVIVVAGFLLILGAVGASLLKRTSDAHSSSIGTYEHAQAHNIAKSGAEIYQRLLRKNPTLSGKTTFDLLDGTATVEIREIIPGDRSRLEIMSDGSYGQASRRVSFEAMMPPSDPPPVTGALCVSYLSKAKLNFGKGTVINGNNHDPDGTPNDSISAIAGLSLGHPDQMGDLEYKPKDVKIKGKGVVEPNIEIQEPQGDYYDWAMRLALSADVNYNAKEVKKVAVLGTTTKPQLTYVSGNTKFNENTTGAGILIIDGNCKFNKRFDFTGLVFVVGDSLTNEKASMGSGSVVTGAIMVAGKKTKVKTGDVDILYSDIAIRRALGLVASHGGNIYLYSNWRE